MSDHDNDQGRGQVPEPQGKFWGAPYDWRRPTAARARARLWNPDDPRVLTPRVWGWGWGWDFNFYWLVRPVRLVRSRRAR